MANLTIKQLVDHIVDCQGKKGKAEESLLALQTQLQAAVESASTPEEKQHNQEDLWFLAGYLESPAAKLADLAAIGKRRYRPQPFRYAGSVEDVLEGLE